MSKDGLDRFAQTEHGVALLRIGVGQGSALVLLLDHQRHELLHGGREVGQQLLAVLLVLDLEHLCARAISTHAHAGAPTSSIGALDVRSWLPVLNIHVSDLVDMLLMREEEEERSRGGDSLELAHSREYKGLKRIDQGIDDVDRSRD